MSGKLATNLTIELSYYVTFNENYSLGIIPLRNSRKA
jgi:hypothetical protein